MSGAPRERAANMADSQAMPATINKQLRPKNGQKPISKSARNVEDSIKKVTRNELDTHRPNPSVLRLQELVLHSNISLSASCSSDASTDSLHSRASTGRMISSSSTSGRRKQLSSKAEGIVSKDGVKVKGRCAWITANTDPSYVTFHDEEWGVPQHDDNKLFELLVLCGALADLTWPTILSKRHIFRVVFANFDPIAVAKMNEKQIIAPGNPGSLPLSELKLSAIIDNARQVSKVIDEFGSFDKYIWGFVKHKPIVGKFRHPRQVPVRTSKANVISKDLVRRGFRSVGPTVIYTFMQVAGITNDHLVSCFRFHVCNAIETVEGGTKKTTKTEIEVEVCGSVEELSFSSE